MGDFHQTGVISTLPRFPNASLERLEADLEGFSEAKPITLVLPSLISELDRPALGRIVGELKDVKYLHQIIVSLDKADGDGFRRAKDFFGGLPQDVKIVWHDGGRLQRLYGQLDQYGLKIATGGKGRGVWVSLAYALAEGGSHMVALHDCDIINYERGLLARLCYPIVNPSLNYEFCKGYYPRVNDHIFGRVTRLFVMPLIRAMQKVFGYTPLLVYLDSFRYPLAGEFAMTADLARVNKLQGDWGLDFGLLAEVFQNSSTQRICQVDLIDTYEHKHQPISEADPEKGLFKMSIDIARTFCRTMVSEGEVFSDDAIETLRMAYVSMARDMIRKYHDTAMINNIPFDRDREDLAVQTFAEGLRLGAGFFRDAPLESPEMPNWNQITSAFPRFPAMLKEAVESDNEQRKADEHRAA
ncbi:MAG: glycosyl transferase [Alphaproteobacteria bacterium]|nr:glycosyl transferase [Alphaproteobacteria bacterium]